MEQVSLVLLISSVHQYYQYMIHYSEEAMVASQAFMTSVVVGKDIVPRIGLHQLERLRHQLLLSLHQSTQPKVTLVSSS